MIAIPPQIGKYRVSGVIGRGGMGIVYRGIDPMLDRPVAIKVLHDPALAEGEVQRRFLQEARAVAGLRHENIVTVYEVDQHDGFTYVAMEYVSGETLQAIVRSGRSRPLDEVLGWIDQLCSGLALAHSRGVIHRDIKPANLMLDEHGALRILDFGIARVEGSTMTADGALIGTLNYMSPEQVHGRPIDHRSDIFAVGVTAYELLSGQQAFPGGAATTLHNILNSDPPALSSTRADLPEDLNAIIGRALAKDPARRFGDLREMQREIRAVRSRLESEGATRIKPAKAPDPVTAPEPVKAPNPVEATVLVERPALFTSVVEQPAAADTIVARPVKWRWSRPRTVAAAFVAVAVIGALIGLFSGRVFEEPRPANDLEVLAQRAIAPHFVNDVRAAVEEQHGARASERGLRVETTLDPDLQEVANATIQRVLAGREGVEAALVAIQNRTGQIRSLVGGSTRDTINRATRARRIGSLFMPVIATAAIDTGYTPISMLDDEAVSFTGGPGEPAYEPTNDDGKFRGPITLRQALEESRNVAMAKLVFSIGPNVLGYARRLGLSGDMSSSEITAGAGKVEATLFDVTSAYATIANQGIRMEPQTVASVADRDGEVIELNRPRPSEALRADTAFMITSLLRGVIERGTATAARSLEWTFAGKTGTVEGDTDAWFVGFDPDITVGVWVGSDEMKPMQSKQAGVSAALSIWIGFMQAYLERRADKANPPRFNPPVNIVFVPVDQGPAQPFISGTQPSTEPPGSR